MTKTNQSMKPLYKLRHNKTGLYKTAGMYGGWNATGKTWSSRGALSGHLALFNKKSPYFEDVEVIVIVPTISQVMSIEEYRTGKTTND